MSIDAMKQALDALEHEARTGNDDAYRVERDALRAAIEQAHDWDEVEALRASLREHMAEIQRLRAALEQAQPELEQAMTDAIIGGTGVMLGDKRIDPASIYKQPEQEPVAWLVQYPNKHEFVWGERPQWIAGAIGIEPLYTTPRQWKELTNEEIEQMMDYWSEDARSAYGGAHRANGEYVYIPDIIRDAEKRLKEKNT